MPPLSSRPMNWLICPRSLHRTIHRISLRERPSRTTAGGERAHASAHLHPAARAGAGVPRGGHPHAGHRVQRLLRLLLAVAKDVPPIHRVLGGARRRDAAALCPSTLLRAVPPRPDRRASCCGARACMAARVVPWQQPRLAPALSTQEEAVRTYTHVIHDLDAGKIPDWSDRRAPEIAISYWNLRPGNDKIRDLLLAVRADEACHSHVNHTLATIEWDAPNPFRRACGALRGGGGGPHRPVGWCPRPRVAHDRHPRQGILSRDATRLGAGKGTPSSLPTSWTSHRASRRSAGLRGGQQAGKRLMCLRSVRPTRGARSTRKQCGVRRWRLVIVVRPRDDHDREGVPLLRDE